MKDFKIFQKSFSYLLPIFFVLPYLLFLRYFSFDVHLNVGELFWALKNSFIQSTIAATVSVVLGLIMALGVYQCAKPLQGLVLKLILLPQVLPSLFSILIAFSVAQPFPIGHAGVIFIFVLVNLGFAAFQIYNAIQEKIGQLPLVAEVYGVKRLAFLRKILLPLIWTDLKLSFVFIFLFCLSSLAIPLVAGGGKGTNLEVLIFEKIFIDQNWSVAWVLMCIQSVLVFGLSYFFLKNRSYQTKEFAPHRYVKSMFGSLMIIGYLLFYIGGYIFNLFQSASAWEFITDYAAEVETATVHALCLLAVILSLGFIILWVWVTDYVQNLKHNLAIHFISASTVLVGFSFYLFFPQTREFDYLKIPLAFLALFFPSLFKMFFEKRIDQLRTQIVVAKVFGLSTTQIAFDIIFKQIKKPLVLATSLLSIWTLSDFAILRALGTQTSTLGLMTQGFMSSYRLEAAYLISFFILVVWFAISAVTYLFIEGLHVSHKKH